MNNKKIKIENKYLKKILSCTMYDIKEQIATINNSIKEIESDYYEIMENTNNLQKINRKNKKTIKKLNEYMKEYIYNYKKNFVPITQEFNNKKNNLRIEYPNKKIKLIQNLLAINEEMSQILNAFSQDFNNI